MGWNDHVNDTKDSIVTCIACGKKYLQWTEDQIAGCRDKDYDICPYCNADNGSSMEIEFHNRKLD